MARYIERERERGREEEREGGGGREPGGVSLVSSVI